MLVPFGHLFPLAILHLFIHVFSVAANRGSNDRRVDDLALMRFKTVVPKKIIKSLKQYFGQIVGLERLLQIPHGVGVGNRIAQPQPEEPLKRQPVHGGSVA